MSRFDVKWPDLGARFDQRHIRLAGIAMGSALLLAATGACDSEDAPFAPRLLYWLGIVALNVGALETTQGKLKRTLRSSRAASRAVGWIILVLPLNTLSLLSCKLLFGGQPTINGFVFLLPGTAAITAMLQCMLAYAKAPSTRPDAVEDVPEKSELVRAMPLQLRQAQILALEAEDHYVRIHTTAGQTLVRMRLTDAIQHVGEDGVQPHRSWWVARRAIASLNGTSKRAMLTLVSGQTVPISRKARSLLGPTFSHVGGT